MSSNLAYQEEPLDELIDGKIVLMSPRPSIDHNRISGNIYSIFRNFLQGKACEAFGDGVDLYLSEIERYVPDSMVVCNKDFIKKNGIYGAPVLLVEILSPSTARNDRGHKKDVYEAAGVREYWIVEPETKTIEIYLLKDGKYSIDEVYSIYPNYLLEKMTDDEISAIVTEFNCSSFEGLKISLNDVFSNTF